MSGGAKFHLGFKTSSFYHLQGAIAVGKRNESSLLRKASPLWHLFPSEFHLFCVGRKRPMGGCPFSSRNQCWGRCHAMAPGSLRPPQARKRRGSWKEPGSFTCPGHSLGWGLCRRNWGSARAPGGAHPMGSTGTQEQGPIRQQDPLGEDPLRKQLLPARPGASKALSPVCMMSPLWCGREVKQTPLQSVGAWSWGIFLRPSVPSREMEGCSTSQSALGKLQPTGQVGKGNRVWSPYKIFCCPSRPSLLQATPQNENSFQISIYCKCHLD